MALRNATFVNLTLCADPTLTAPEGPRSLMGPFQPLVFPPPPAVPLANSSESLRQPMDTESNQGIRMGNMQWFEMYELWITWITGGVVVLSGCLLAGIPRLVRRAKRWWAKSEPDKAAREQSEEEVDKAILELSTEEDSISAPRVEVDSKEGEKASATPQPIIAQEKSPSAEEAKRRAWRKTFDANADARRTDLP